MELSELTVPNTSSKASSAGLSSSTLTVYDAEALKDENIDHSNYPEGGWAAWLVVLGSFLIYFSSSGVMTSFGVFQEFYICEFLSDYSTTQIAFIGSLQLSLLYVIGPIIGPIFDAKGLKHLYFIGMTGTVSSLFALSFTRPQQIWQQFLSQGVLFGLTAGCGYQPAITVVGHYFKRRRALALGIAGTGSSIGGLCLPIIFSRLLESIGFAWSARVAALIMLCCYTIAIVVSKTRLPPKPLKKQKEILDFHGFTDRRYAVLEIACFLVNLGLLVPHNYIGPSALLYDVSDSLRPYLLSMINGVSLFGRLMGGQLADIAGCLNVLSPATLFAGILCLSLWLKSTGAVTFTLFACSYGFFAGVYMTLEVATVSRLSPVEKLGARIGTFYLPIAVASLLGTPIGGAFVKSGTKEEYHRVAIFAGAMICSGGMLLYVTRLLCSRNIRAKW
ncbi:hypothetical protein ACEPAF_2866 [Sanghuangporus sanghuang]